ncbi:MAG TPA: sugar ABC transporter substrate-binding protein [Chloroflexota bacterium]|nr:sugar ABC transporter substrate-binding protein [Chloroflexota bacterium]
MTRRSLLAGGAASAGALLAACGGPNQQPAAQTLQPATVEWRHSASSDAAVQRWTDFSTDVKAALAEKKITVNLVFETTQMWEKMQVEYAGGSGPDVVYNQVSWVIPGGVRGIFMQLDDLAKRDKIKRESYSAGAWDSWVWKNKLYAIAYSGFGECVFLYKKLFTESNVPLPKLDWTWDDFLDAAKKLTKGEGQRKQFGAVLFHGGDWQLTGSSWMMNNGGKVLSEARDKALFGDDAKSIQGFEWLTDLRLRHGVDPKNDERTPAPTQANPNATLQPMNEGRAAMEIARFSRYSEWIQMLGNGNVEIYPLPAGPAKRRTHAVGTNAWSVGGRTKVKDAAWEVTKWLTGPGGQTGKGARVVPFPSLLAGGTSKEFLDQYAGTHLKDVVDAWGKDSHDYMVNPDSTEVNPIFNKHSTAAFNGEKTARQALRDAQEEMNVVFNRRPADLR